VFYFLKVIVKEV
jgi:hypothetical protein